jgi:creatinine amidohydrolase/Fe(II)-dependent formamide hydrolase-like protein
MLKGGLTIPQAQAITGHKSERMTEWYCHFDPAEFAQARRVQEKLLAPENTKPVAAVAKVAKKTAKGKAKEGTEKAGKKGRVISFPAQENTKKRKHA